MKGLKRKLGSVCLEIVLILMKDRCTVCMERTIFLDINLDALDRTPRSCVSYGISLQSVGDSVSLGARLVHGLRIMHHRLGNHYGSTR